ncbi:hypothetical protein KJ785_04180 [Patescibacteria group bacterium]|nr:hypothetical protein [Patescibacteria group bacterium]
MIEIIPSILVKSQDEFIAQVSGLENSVSMIQLDIADGIFVPNITWADPEVVKNNCNLDIELHLMVDNPTEELKKWTEVEQIKRILIHYESFTGTAEQIDYLVSDTINFIDENDWQIGIVLNPNTSYKNIEKYLDKIQSVMFMGVIPGKQGQGLIPEVLEKIINFTIDYPDMFTEIDGAVNEETLPSIIKTGVKAVCPGSAIFGNDRSPKENVEVMRDIINKLT